MKMIQKQIFLIILICSFFLLHGSQRDSNTQVHGELVQEPADEAAYTTNRKVTNLSDVCKSDDIDHWRQNQTNAFKCKQHEWRHTGKVAQMCTPKIDLDNELGFLAIIVEGALCNGAFEPLRPPRVFNFPSRLWELRCYPEFTGREIKEIEFRLGMMILTGAQHGYTGFPILPSIFERLVDLRQRRPRVPLPNPYKHKYAVIAASPITCEVEMNFIALPAINYTGQAVIFRTFEADSRNCGYMKPNGHDALAIVPYRIRQDSIQENIRIMLYHMKTTLRPFSKSLRFFTSGLRFHGVRVVIIEASFLYDEIAESPINMERVLPTTNRTVIFQPIVHNLLASLFMQGIVVCLATFDQTVQTASVRPQLVTVDDMPIFLSPGAPPSPTYLTLIKALATSFSGHVLEHQKGFRVASLSRTRQLYRPQPLVSLVVDGVQAAKVKGPIGKVHRELTGDLPVTQLINFWRDIASLHKNIEPEDTQRGLDESEILVVTTVSRDLVRCKRCVVVQSHGNKIELVELSIVS